MQFPLTAWIPALQPAPTRRRWQEASCTWRSGMAARRTVVAAQIEQVLRLVREILRHDVLGAYQHGSAVLGGHAADK
jgi:hypothetical protein